jgi:hypothetical protein
MQATTAKAATLQCLPPLLESVLKMTLPYPLQSPPFLESWLQPTPLALHVSLQPPALPRLQLFKLQTFPYYSTNSLHSEPAGPSLNLPAAPRFPRPATETSFVAGCH